MCAHLCSSVKIIAEHEKDKSSTSGDLVNNEGAEDHQLVSRVHEVCPQTQFTKKKVSIQFRSKHSCKGKCSFLFCGRNPNFPILILLDKRGKLFSLISLTQVFKRPFPRKVKVHHAPFSETFSLHQPQARVRMRCQRETPKKRWMQMTTLPMNPTPRRKQMMRKSLMTLMTVCTSELFRNKSMLEKGKWSVKSKVVSEQYSQLTHSIFFCFRESPQHASVHQQKLFLVAESSLLSVSVLPSLHIRMQ